MTEQSQPAATSEERPLWKLDRNEQRVLLITFVGGVASLIVSAFIIGAAIALAHATHATKPVTNGVGNAISVGSAIALVLMVIAFTAVLREPAPPGKRFDAAIRRVAWVYIGICALALIFLLLTGLGLAAGVH
jgi:hypothetical protein